MRILFVGRNARIGGGSTFRYNIARGLLRRGHQVWLACQPGEMLPRFRQIGVRHVWTPPAPWGGPWIEHAIRANGIELVHASNATPGRAGEWAALRTGTPFMMSVHGLLGKNDHHATCLRTARRILTFEEVAVDNLRSREVIDMSKVVLLRRPIEHAPQPLERDTAFDVVAVSRLSKRKGQNVLNLIAAFERFLQTEPAATLRILGDGSLLREVRRAARDCNRRVGSERIRVLGSIPEPAPIVRPAHVLVGASYCALEAIMQNVAVIGAGFWGYGLIEGENLRDAMAWNFGDVGGNWAMDEENFLTALRELHRAWHDDAGRHRYWKLDQHIEEEHSLDRVVGRIERIYEQVLAGEPCDSGATAVPA